MVVQLQHLFKSSLERQSYERNKANLFREVNRGREKVDYSCFKQDAAMKLEIKVIKANHKKEIRECYPDVKDRRRIMNPSSNCK